MLSRVGGLAERGRIRTSDAFSDRITTFAGCCLKPLSHLSRRTIQLLGKCLNSQADRLLILIDNLENRMRFGVVIQLCHALLSKASNKQVVKR